MIQPYDIAMLVVLISMTLFGVWKGVAWQVAALASVILSGVVAVQGSASVAPYISADEPWNRCIAMLVLYVITAAAIWIVFRMVSNIIDRVKLKEFDRQLGAIFGFAKGVLYCLIITFFAVTLSEASRLWVLQSKSGDYIARGIQKANPILPEEVREWLGKYIDEMDERLHAPPEELPKEATPKEPDALAPIETLKAAPKETPPETPKESRGEGVLKKLKQKITGK
jgi:membrane protein required for colicin V production